ncbi:DUF5696 domain-containing protein [Paenibacillus septentrionalis]|uniref:DUF5696 domain-containing protein n=2 Tax=Paenibacillus septentrionalis TaxID=429342 RepID=A0ABW1VB22_9BACL
MISNLSKSAINRMKNAGVKEMIMAAILILMIIALFFIPGTVQSFSIKSQAMPQYAKDGAAATNNEIDQQAGNVKLASSEDRELYIDTKTLNIKVVDTQTRTQWNSLALDQGSSDIDKSPILIKFLGKDGALYEWDAYKFAIQNQRYTLYEIDNGVQIIFDFFESESYRLNEYVPQKIMADHYQEHFLDKIEEKLQEGAISDAQAAKFKDSLSLTYQYDREHDLYYFRFAGLPPLSLVRDLIQMTKSIDYTTDMLIEESQLHDIAVKITQPANFSITMEVTLDQGDLVVKVPTYEITNENDFYTMQNITVLPSFGMAAASKVAEGYILVPDGSGALFKMNDFNGRYPEYERPVYNNSYYSTLYELPAFPENLTMPVFGLYYTDQAGKSMGHMGIIEKGAELGNIKVQLGVEDTSLGGAPYNKVYSSFDSMQFSRVKVFGPYSDNDARFLASTGVIDVDYTVRYKLFSSKVEYYDLAKTYQQYLVDRYNLSYSYDERPKLFVDVIGALTLEKRFLGIPYEEPHSMTTYHQLLDILKDMENINAVVNYKGVFNGGLDNTIGNKAELLKVNGSKAELLQLMQHVEGSNQQIFFNADLMRVTDTDDGFKPKKHALHGFDGKPLSIHPYNYATGRFKLYATGHYVIHPLYLSDTVDRFIESSSEYANIFVNDMGAMYYANYKDNEVIDPVIANSILQNNLEKLAQNKTIALDNPNSDKLAYAKYAANISRESSNYGTMHASIPFRQLVMNGLTEYTTLNVNQSSERSQYFILQALELGSIPKFTITHENVDILKNTEYSEYLSTEYAVLERKIKEIYEEYSAGIDKIASKEIVGHRMLEENVFETSYASGKKVIVNYNKYPVTVAGHQLDALGYMIQ